MPNEEIKIHGTVQGVGFRPTIYRLAKAEGLRGYVCNNTQGVLIRVSGFQTSIEKFIQRLQQESPPLARIHQITRRPCEDELTFDDFTISNSVSGLVKTEITPDAATCPECKAEIFDAFSRWYRYPFTNCTHCGPRLSIIRAIPYDRHNTSMGAFAMCADCEEEYKDIENRRFHTQPVACHICGPQATLERADSQPITASMFSMLDDVDAVCTLLQKGEIVAIKGLGGFHLACDATQEAAVEKLRQRKKRDRKPLALMARDIAIIEEYCILSNQERELLESVTAPIVLLHSRGGEGSQRCAEVPSVEATGVERGGGGEGGRGRGGEKPQPKTLSVKSYPIAPGVAPGQNTLGFILPYTPLHHLILKRMNRPIVFTSGNLSEEPQCIDNEQARHQLGKIADYFLFHNREIVNRVDDSVVRVVGGKIQTIRRARGYAPAPIHLPPGFNSVPQILAMGSELKNTFCLLRDEQAILSQHLGDLENAATFKAYQETLNLYLNLFQHKPVAIAVDLHPEYLSTKLGKQLAATHQIKLYNIQHHHAHIAACMAENNIPLDEEAVLGIALDGLGYGEDGRLWGGEFLLADYHSFKRLATFKPVAMIGGTQAIKQPWRNTYAQLISAFTWQDLKNQYGNLELLEFLLQLPLNLLNQLVEKRINSPEASSVGRLFDAVAAAIGICREECSYEGQAAIEMSALVEQSLLINSKETLTSPFDINISDSIYCIDPKPMWQDLLNDLQQQIPPPVIAAKFHQGLADVIVKMVDRLCQENVINKVVLTGGVFQNCILLEQVSQGLEKSGRTVLTHSLVPSNDGGLSLGQAVIASARISRKNLIK